MIILIGYIILINVAAFILCGADKRKAVEHKWRISEAALLTVSAAGGRPRKVVFTFGGRRRARNADFHEIIQTQDKA